MCHNYNTEKKSFRATEKPTMTQPYKADDWNDASTVYSSRSSQSGSSTSTMASSANEKYDPLGQNSTPIASFLELSKQKHLV